ncbi:MAG: hypothetical protein ABFD92_14405 [Planctomycetaceae bacterium]|nr:hypothetical protein [Planctomycetaceae bacterium]
MRKNWVVVLLLAQLALAGNPELRPARQPAEWAVAENNPIVQIYVGQTTPEGTELVFELSSMHFYSNQRLYGCIFVSGQIAYIKEYNKEDSYVRAAVKLAAGDEELIAYSGVIKAIEKIDPNDHAALWKAFVNSPHTPFRAKLSSLPQWYVINPINARKVTTQPMAPAESSGAGGYPYLKPEERPIKAKEALDPVTGDKTRFRAVWGLAISGYSRESAEALAIIASDSKYDATTRGYAGMGLSNFSNAIPKGIRQAALDRLYGALSVEREKLPDGVMRTLINWGAADRVRQALGEKLLGHRMEIDVLQRIDSREEAVARLMELHKAAADVTGSIGWTQRWHVGAALIDRQDKCGIDILIECLTVKEPWPIDNPSPQAKESNAASFRQSLHNTFTRLATIFDDRFGYEAGGTWTPQLDDAIPKMVEWWMARRQTWSFEEASLTDLPTLEKDKALTKRQARVLAAKLANDAFAERTFKHANGKPVGKIEITPESFNEVIQKDGRWVLRMVRSRGPEAFVKFDSDGLNRTVVVNYALR